MPPFLGQGANQAVQDSYCLARKISEYNKRLSTSSLELINEEEKSISLQEYLKDYENTRWKPTSDITLKAALLGYLETGGKGIPSKFRDVFFFTLDKLGVAQRIYLGGATPKV